MPEPRLTIITDNARRAAISVFGADAPAWARIIDDPLDILAIPDGTKCQAVWFCARQPRSAAEQAWLERRLSGGIDFMSDDDRDRFFAWRDGEPVARPKPSEQPAPAKTPDAVSTNPMLTQVWM